MQNKTIIPGEYGISVIEGPGGSRPEPTAAERAAEQAHEKAYVPDVLNAYFQRGATVADIERAQVLGFPKATGQSFARDGSSRSFYSRKAIELWLENLRALNAMVK